MFIFYFFPYLKFGVIFFVRDHPTMLCKVFSVKKSLSWSFEILVSTDCKANIGESKSLLELKTRYEYRMLNTSNKLNHQLLVLITFGRQIFLGFGTKKTVPNTYF